jgi:hypothetical protein
MIKYRLPIPEMEKIVPVVLSKNEFFSTEFKGIELENIDAADKKRNSISIMA